MTLDLFMDANKKILAAVLFPLCRDSFHTANRMLKIHWVAHGAVNPSVMQLLA